MCRLTVCLVSIKVIKFYLFFSYDSLDQNAKISNFNIIIGINVLGKHFFFFIYITFEDFTVYFSEYFDCSTFYFNKLYDFNSFLLFLLLNILKILKIKISEKLFKTKSIFKFVVNFKMKILFFNFSTKIFILMKKWTIYDL